MPRQAASSAIPRSVLRLNVLSELSTISKDSATIRAICSELKVGGVPGRGASLKNDATYFMYFPSLIFKDSESHRRGKALSHLLHHFRTVTGVVSSLRAISFLGIPSIKSRTTLQRKDILFSVFPERVRISRIFFCLLMRKSIFSSLCSSSGFFCPVAFSYRLREKMIQLREKYNTYQKKSPRFRN